MRLTRLYPRTQIKAAVRTIMVPRPVTALMGGQPVVDTELLEWAADFIRAIVPPPKESQTPNALQTPNA
jgi:transcription-repair coupling factor (superfamily II helicase)